MSIHRLRAYANQCIQAACGDKFSEVILGHIAGLRTYDVGNIRKMKKDYDKAISLLTLDKSKQYEDLIGDLTVNNTTNKIIINEIEHLKQEILRLQNSVLVQS